MINACNQGLVLERIERGPTRRLEAGPRSCSSGAPSRPHLTPAAEPRVLRWSSVRTRTSSIVERGFEAFNDRGVEGILPFIHPEFEATTPPNLASEPDTYRGHDGVRRWFDSFYEVMDEIRWDAHRLSAGRGPVVVEFTLRARGKTTGLDFGQDAVMVWSMRDGKAIRVELFETLDDALRAAREASELIVGPRPPGTGRGGRATRTTTGIRTHSRRPGTRIASGIRS